MPFPVQVPFRMQPGLARFDGVPCEPDVRANQIRGHVEHAIQTGRLPLGCWRSGELAAAVDETVTLLTGADGRDDASKYNPAAALRALRLHVPDDIVLMAPGKLARVAALAVAMPSGWDPADKLGLDFRALHQPVPDARSLDASAAQLSKMICSGGPYRRHVWTLSGNDSLSQHPADHDDSSHGPGDWCGVRRGDGSDLVARYDGIWFRVERQTTVPLQRSGFALFLIRVWHEPLSRVLAAAPGREDLLRDALASMSDAVVAYKNLGRLRAYILGEQPRG